MIQMMKKILWFRHGNARLLTVSTALISTILSYVFVSIFVSSKEYREKTTHLYNAYQIGLSIENKIESRFQSSGDESFSLINDDGSYRYTEAAFNVRSQMEDGQMYTLDELIKEEFIIDSSDPTIGQVSSLQEYDREYTTVKIMYEYVLESFVNGDAVKKIKKIHYLVNLARAPIDESSTYTNVPYDPDTPFYYVVSYVDDSTVFLTDDHITFRFRNGEPIGSILTDGTEIQHSIRAEEVVLLPVSYRE